VRGVGSSRVGTAHQLGFRYYLVRKYLHYLLLIPNLVRDLDRD
jgi:hypothetical protein